MRWTAAIVSLTAMLLPACGGTVDTTTTSAAPVTTPTTVAETTTTTPTTTTAPVTSTATTTTTVATVPIEVVGDEAFTDQTDAALALLAIDAAEGYEQVVTYIAVIESVPAGSGMDVFTKTYLVGDETAFAPGFELDDQVVWYAGTIVHDSCHSRLYSDDEPYTGRDAELECMVDQLAALEAIGHGFYQEYVQGLIDGVDDPENAYWNDPNRHW